MTPEQAHRWCMITGDKIGRSERFAWVEAFGNEPDAAVVWHHLCTEAGWGDPYGANAAIAARMRRDGMQPEDLPGWTRLAKRVGTVADWVTASGGDLQVAQRFHKAFNRNATAARTATRMAGSVRDVEAWVRLGVRAPRTIGILHARGITPTEVQDARRGGVAERVVDCGGVPHVVSVRWRNGRPTWETRDHDRRLDQVASAFGSTPSDCHRCVHDAKQMWAAGSGAATPGLALTAYDTSNDIDRWLT